MAHPLARACLLLCALILAGCESQVPVPLRPEISFRGQPPIQLDVAGVEVADEYFAPQRPPNVEHLFPVSIAGSVDRWARERLRAVGTSRGARVVIKDASAVETAAPEEAGVRGLFAKPMKRYDARVETIVEIRSGVGPPEATASAVVVRSRTAPADLGSDERDRVFFELTEALMRDLNAEIERSIRTFFGRYLQ